MTNLESSGDAYLNSRKTTHSNLMSSNLAKDRTAIIEISPLSKI